jgi:hypothetical protein
MSRVSAWLLPVLGGGLLGCSHMDIENVQSYGSGQYVIYGSASRALVSEAHSRALQRATIYCLAEDKRIRVTEDQQSGGALALRFVCE